MTRSNRSITQFAVNRLVDFISNPNPEFFSEAQGNTTVSVHLDKISNELTFQVFLFDTSVFELDARCLIVRNGGFFDSKGRPSKTTRERLNGLLDASGELGLIPKGVRAFLGNNGQKETCLVGRGENVGLLDSASADRVIVRDSDKLVIF